jgi:hypothetical protein
MSLDDFGGGDGDAETGAPRAEAEEDDVLLLP